MRDRQFDAQSNPLRIKSTMLGQPREKIIEERLGRLLAARARVPRGKNTPEGLPQLNTPSESGLGRSWICFRQSSKLAGCRLINDARNL